MPAKPTWCSDLPHILQVLRASPRSFVDRATVENLLGVGRRRAQQILAPCVSDRIGANGLADRQQLMTRLEQLARGEELTFEVQRRQRFARSFQQLRQERIRQPQLLVEAPAQIVNTQFRDLPPGVHLEPGTLRVDFHTPQEALEKLLALAMAISNDFQLFERLTTNLKDVKQAG